MPADKKTPAPNSAKAKASVAPSTNGTATPVSVADTSDLVSTGRPDKSAFDSEQAKIKTEIDSLQLKLSTVREKIGQVTGKAGPGNERRTALRTELDGLKDSQATSKHSRGKILDQVKAYNEGIQKKVKDLNAAKSKIPYKTVAEVDAHIKALEKQVESGSMKLVEEKRALAEISTSKRNRRAVESFQADQEAIEVDRRAVEELKKQLDDPTNKAAADRYDAIKKELDDIKKEGDEVYAGRSKLFEERDSLQNQINALYNQKRESSQKYKDANDRYWSKVNEDRARRAERMRAQRAAEEAEKKKEIAERLREEAEAPAFQADIEDCQTLIDYLLGTNTEAPTFKTLSVKGELAGVPKLALRQVSDAAPEGIIRKKKGEDEEAYFVGKGKKGKKTTPKANGSTEPATGQLNLPFSTLSALLSLSIPPPTGPGDTSRVVEDLKTKKAWFEANQARVTADNIAKAEAEIKRLVAAAEAATPAATPSAPTPDASPEAEKPAVEAEPVTAES